MSRLPSGKMTKSARGLAAKALSVAQRALPDYSHRNSPRKFFEIPGLICSRRGRLRQGSGTTCAKDPPCCGKQAGGWSSARRCWTLDMTQREHMFRYKRFSERKASYQRKPAGAPLDDHPPASTDE